MADPILFTPSLSASPIDLPVVEKDQQSLTSCETSPYNVFSFGDSLFFLQRELAENAQLWVLEVLRFWRMLLLFHLVGDQRLIEIEARFL
ncbi:hypothetical protein OUZ56_006327 [Daphnia magna]|uniref:Uncharacterized protein n=1 Tax=Daphnia magna TaxID=35525 RepID=A0ABQ9YVB2_9CRUS|nr:hypothetical protein OUZ56_006327 [Daphnia magna]